ncbi:hypothetical protein I317_01102 [Kwoniella heveanensis CBS 569]|nr:hypothetical protein I317_01102 [Kwoniella heveanensis CBS 569]
MSESVLEDSNAAASTSAPPVPETGKKRKRTGKEREERKRLAIQAQKDAEEAASKAATIAEQTSTAEGGAGVTPAKVEGESSAEAAGMTEIQQKAAVDIEKAIKRVPQALKTLHPIFKQGKTFETRRLIKKIKFLRTKPDAKAELADLEGQLTILHDIQLHPLSQSHLLLKLRKHPSFKHAPLPSSLVDLLTPSKPPTSKTATSSTSATPALVNKVENRLCSAKNVADVMRGVVSWVVGEEGAKLNAVKVAKEKTEKSGQAGSESKGSSKVRLNVDNSDEVEGGIEDDENPGSRNMVVGSDEEEELDDSVEEGRNERYQDSAADAAGWESGSIGGDDLEGASDSDADSDSEAIAIPSAKKPKLQAAAPSLSKQQQPKTQSKPQKAEKGDITSSMFLPSLSTGFTRGDEGDSDPDLDYDPDGVIGKQGAVRKNRRGQRARQAIWEKKYGKNAKHVVKARQEEETKQAHKAQRQFDKRGKPEGMKGRDAGWGNRSNGNGGPIADAETPPSFGAHALAPTAAAGPAATGVGGRPRPQEEQKKNLHPSWEAARLRKQKMAAVSPAGAAKPNKIVFD